VGFGAVSAEKPSIELRNPLIWFEYLRGSRVSVVEFCLFGHLSSLDHVFGAGF
jgi:hypothetical protein